MDAPRARVIEHHFDYASAENARQDAEPAWEDTGRLRIIPNYVYSRGFIVPWGI